MLYINKAFNYEKFYNKIFLLYKMEDNINFLLKITK